MNEFNFAQQGWQCPICKRVYSPFTPSCFYCGNEKTVTTTGVTITTGTPSTQDTVITAGSAPSDTKVEPKATEPNWLDRCDDHYESEN